MILQLNFQKWTGKDALHFEFLSTLFDELCNKKMKENPDKSPQETVLSSHTEKCYMSVCYLVAPTISCDCIQYITRDYVRNVCVCV